MHQFVWPNDPLCPSSMNLLVRGMIMIENAQSARDSTMRLSASGEKAAAGAILDRAQTNRKRQGRDYSFGLVR